MNTASPNHSDEKAFRVAYLISSYIRKTLTEAEHDELDAWVEASDDNMKLFEDLTDEANIEANLAFMEKVQTEAALKDAAAKLKFNRTPIRKTRKAGWAYAAAATVLTAIAALFLFRKEVADVSPPVQTAVKADVQPGGNRATLNLSDGSVVDLSRANNSALENESGASIQKVGDSGLVYESKEGSAQMNVLTTPRGGQYSLTLSDGTKVWLNAASSLRFPTRFDSSLRQVTLTGEAYFEVAENKAKSFVVQLANQYAVRVLGTAFNISSYPDDEKEVVTLVQGKVQASGPGGRLELKPGQSAVMSSGGVSINRAADVESATAWKRGEFIFRDRTMASLLNDIERWYDVEVDYKAGKSDHFNFSISRNEPLSKVLRLMALTGKFNYKIENNKVYVLP